MSDQLNGLDILGAINTLLGLANYGENVTQRGMQEDLKEVIADIHSDFAAQNKALDRLEDKVDMLISAMGDKNDEICKQNRRGHDLETDIYGNQQAPGNSTDVSP